MIADAVAGPYLVAAGVIGVAGLAKARAPDAAAGVLAALRLPTSRHLARALGVAELGLALWAAIAPGRTVAILLAAAYVALAGVAAILVARGPSVSSCGCLGARPIPPSRGHVALDAGLAVAAALAAVWPPPALDGLLSGLPFAGVPFLLGIAAATWLAVAVLADLPRVLAARHGGG